MDELVTRVIAYYNNLRNANISQSAAEDMARDWQQGQMDIERERIIARASTDTDAIARIVREEISRVMAARR